MIIVLLFINQFDKEPFCRIYFVISSRQVHYRRRTLLSIMWNDPPVNMKDSILASIYCSVYQDQTEHQLRVAVLKACVKPQDIIVNLVVIAGHVKITGSK